MKPKPKLILASASPRRRQLLKQSGYRFSIIPSHVKETVPRGISPQMLVRTLALKKAQSIAKRFPERIVLGADTIVYINGHIVGKPRDKNHARRLLEEQSGSWQRVYTGVAVVWAGGKKSRVGSAVSGVLMRPLTEWDIERASLKHLDKAGAYAVQEKKDPFVKRIKGDFDNVVGLPMRLVKKLTRGLL